MNVKQLIERLQQFDPETMAGSASWPRPWRKWNGNYQKIFYDIQTTWGKTHIGCWPNAGKMNACDGTGRSWKPHQVALIRRSLLENKLLSQEQITELRDAGEGVESK